MYQVSYAWLEEMAEKVYGHALECVACWEQGNDTYNMVDVDGKEIDDKWEQKSFDEFVKNGMGDYHTPGLVMNDLCKKGYLEPGRYIVEISW